MCVIMKRNASRKEVIKMIKITSNDVKILIAGILAQLIADAISSNFSKIVDLLL